MKTQNIKKQVKNNTQTALYNNFVSKLKHCFIEKGHEPITKGFPAIVAATDYHDFDFDKFELNKNRYGLEKYAYEELGCLGNYYAVFYRGRKPLFLEVFNALCDHQFTANQLCFISNRSNHEVSLSYGKREFDAPTLEKLFAIKEASKLKSLAKNKKRIGVRTL